MADFPIIPVDVFRGTSCSGAWTALVAHYQGRPDVTITSNEITETAANGSVIKYQYDGANQCITWQMKSPAVS